MVLVLARDSICRQDACVSRRGVHQLVVGRHSMAAPNFSGVEQMMSASAERGQVRHVRVPCTYHVQLMVHSQSWASMRLCRRTCQLVDGQAQARSQPLLPVPHFLLVQRSCLSALPAVRRTIRACCAPAPARVLGPGKWP